MGRLFISNSHNKDYGHFSIGSGYPKGLIHSVCQAGRRNNIYEGEPPVKRGIGGRGRKSGHGDSPHTHMLSTLSLLVQNIPTSLRFKPILSTCSGQWGQRSLGVGFGLPGPLLPIPHPHPALLGTPPPEATEQGCGLLLSPRSLSISAS